MITAVMIHRSNVPAHRFGRRCRPMIILSIGAVPTAWSGHGSWGRTPPARSLDQPIASPILWHALAILLRAEPTHVGRHHVSTSAQSRPQEAFSMDQGIAQPPRMGGVAERDPRLPVFEGLHADEPIKADLNTLVEEEETLPCGFPDRRAGSRCRRIRPSFPQHVRADTLGWAPKRMDSSYVLKTTMRDTPSGRFRGGNAPRNMPAMASANCPCMRAHAAPTLQDTT